MKQELMLNVSELPPPEPMEKVLETLEILNAGQYIRMLHTREPFPLYSILEDNGYLHRMRMGEENLFEIFIWRKNDEIAQTAVRQQLDLG